MKWGIDKNYYELSDKQKQLLVKRAVLDYIGNLEKRLAKEKKQAEKWSIKQRECINESRAKRTSITAKTDLCWESVRSIEADITALKEFLEGA